ncbi:MAG: flagellar brake protein [Armatimonadota bacterium]|nr:flagellar brake protein [Armatimonadota bacterium]MDW8155936.1 flagellar brake protein [Armatimonadota bacterium]
MQLRVNQRVELWLGGRAFPVRVEEVGPGHVLVSAPMDGPRPVLPSPGTRVRGRLYGQGRAWEFEGVVERCVRGPVETVCVRLEGVPYPVDRRALPRRPVSMRVYVARSDHVPPKLVAAQLADLSEGGCQLELLNPWPEPSVGERLVVTLPGRSPAAVNGQVVWVRPRFERGRNFAVGVAWSPGSGRTVRRLLEP